MASSNSAGIFQVSRKKLGYFLHQNYALPVYEWSQCMIRPEPKIMRSILDTVLEMFSRSTKVLVVRFDLHVKEHSETNLILSKFSKMLTKILYKNYAKTWFHLIWVREHGHSPCQHYHCVLLANGHKVNHPGKLNKLMAMCWHEVSGGTFSLPANCYYLWQPGNNKLFGQIIYRLSYLAKNTTKKRFNMYTKRHGNRRISGDQQKQKKSLTQLLPMIN